MTDTNERLHHEWLGMAQPDGLVVTATALKAAEANITWPVTELQLALAELAGEGKIVLEVGRFLCEILGWSDELLLGPEQIPDSLRVPLDGGEHLAPRFALRSADEPDAFVLLVHVERWRAGLDAATDDKRWTATPHQKFERLLRETGVHVGLLTNGAVFRLVYAPKGESAGWLDFRVEDLLTVDGRPLLGAMHMLLNERRLLALQPEKRLAGLLKASREYQSTVSNKLREQVLAAIRELLGGFEHADRIAHGKILGEVRREEPQQIYLGLVTVLMRMVFVLFAEERGLLPMDRDLYADGYSLTRLYAQLVEDRGRFGDGMDDRYGAWARILTLFRLLHDGVRAADGTYLPPRKGDLFDADKFQFLEGRARGSVRQLGETLDAPRVSDGVVFRVLDRLLVLDGERLQYRGLDVEQIGSVYEGLMGFELQVAEGPSRCLTPEHVVVNLEALLALPGAERVKWLKANAGLDLKDKAAGEVRGAGAIDALQAALARRISPRQPGLIPAGSLYLQPGEERRKSGSHYTPKSLTGPIVETTLRPVLERLGPDVAAEQILDLKVCDPAMGSAAFLVEACRQLADHLVAAWRRTGTMPDLPPDEDPVLHARRLVAQRCLYGVDKNPLAVDLARLSMWLVTFAKEHPFTFVDHALRCGDSLVGLSREQIASLALDVSKGTQLETVRAVVEPAVKRAMELRQQIHAIGDPPDTARLVELWRETNEALETVRMLGDLVVAAFFSAGSDKARKAAYDELATKVRLWLATGAHEAELRGMRAGLREGEKGVEPFHWEVEFPEVFGRKIPGFDCFVGNPPFAGKNTVTAAGGEYYIDYLQVIHRGAHGNSDLVAHFFRRAFLLLAAGGTLGLIATNTLAQGDTRMTGLGWMCEQGAEIYEARRRVRWPGAASVVVSVVHVARTRTTQRKRLDGRDVSQITAFLFHAGGNADPVQLRSLAGRSFVGSYVLGSGFLFDDDAIRDGASSMDDMQRLVQKDPRNAERIAPYLGGEELNTHPCQRHRRYVIDFGEMLEAEARAYPDLISLLEARVKPVRSRVAQRDRRELWWMHATRTPAVRAYLRNHARCLAVSQLSSHLGMAFVPAGTVFSLTLVLFLFDDDAAFALLQSRVHELWARFFSSSMKDDVRYIPTDCFETFPFPKDRHADDVLGLTGRAYYAHRAALMLANNEGLTKTYNRFHDPKAHSPEIQKLRDLHADMDRAVLDAYGWIDIRPTYDFREQLDESIRLTWDEGTRDEVLARLLELNRVRAEEEALQLPAKESQKRSARRQRRPGGPLLPGMDDT